MKKIWIYVIAGILLAFFIYMAISRFTDLFRGEPEDKMEIIIQPGEGEYRKSQGIEDDIENFERARSKVEDRYKELIK